jgi:hypothetical protein
MFTSRSPKRLPGKFLYWLVLSAGLGLAALLLLVFHGGLAGSSAVSAPTATALQATRDAQTLQAESLIDNFERNAHNINVYRSAALRADYYTGTLLEEWNSYFAALDGSNTWRIVTDAQVNQVSLVNASAEKITALACVTESRMELDQKGKLIQQLPGTSFAGAYVFVPDGSTWKLAYFLDVSDAASARSTYASSAADLQELAGPISALLKIKCP